MQAQFFRIQSFSRPALAVLSIIAIAAGTVSVNNIAKAAEPGGAAGRCSSLFLHMICTLPSWAYRGCKDIIY